MVSIISSLFCEASNKVSHGFWVVLIPQVLDRRFGNAEIPKMRR
jgi:hypothetical protein